MTDLAYFAASQKARARRVLEELHASRSRTFAHMISPGLRADCAMASLKLAALYRRNAQRAPERCHDGSPSEVDDIRILTVDGKPWPVDLSYGFQTPAQDHDTLTDKLLNDHHDYMIECATEQAEEAGQ